MCKSYRNHATKQKKAAYKDSINNISEVSKIVSQKLVSIIILCWKSCRTIFLSYFLEIHMTGFASFLLANQHSMCHTNQYIISEERCLNSVQQIAIFELCKDFFLLRIIYILFTKLCWLLNICVNVEKLICNSYILSGFWQAYTLELEAEVAKLKELNQELERKQVSFLNKVKFLFLN